jgi:hypothetical protein
MGSPAQQLHAVVVDVMCSIMESAILLCEAARASHDPAAIQRTLDAAEKAYVACFHIRRGAKLSPPEVGAFEFQSVKLERAMKQLEGRLSVHLASQPRETTEAPRRENRA